jgi:DNA-binding NarL/FixJ family response regulator
MPRIRVLLADDHELVRSGLRALLETLPDVEVVGDTGNGRAAIELTGECKPDIVLMDIEMPGLNGLEATARLQKTSPRTRIIILSMHADARYVAEALQAGASGYLLKNSEPKELALALTTVARGKTWLSPTVSREVVRDYLDGDSYRATPRARLTPRQRETLQLIAEGKSTKRIAALLGVSVKTIETHRAQIMRRLEIHDVAGLVRYAIRHGLVQVDR